MKMNYLNGVLILNKKLSKEDFKKLIINAKWAEPYGSFADSEFCERIILYIGWTLSDLGHKDTYTKKYLNNDWIFKPVNEVIKEFVDIDIKHLGDIFIEAEQEFEKEFYEKD